MSSKHDGFSIYCYQKELKSPDVPVALRVSSFLLVSAYTSELSLSHNCSPVTIVQCVSVPVPDLKSTCLVELFPLHSFLVTPICFSVLSLSTSLLCLDSLN